MITLRIAGTNGCCDCAQQPNPCECQEDCALVCRTKSGDAELCGHSEFTASSPPKKYRRKDTTTLDPLHQINHADEDCIELACAGAWAGEYPKGSYPGIGEGDVEYEGVLVPISSTATHVTFRSTCSATVYTSPTPTEVAARIEGQERAPGAGSFQLLNGETVELAKGTVWDVRGQFLWVTWNSVAEDHCLEPDEDEQLGFCDTWEGWSQYAQADCAITQSAAELSFRKKITQIECPAGECDCEDSEQDAELIPCSGPEDCYGAGGNVNPQSPTERLIGGAGCVELGGGKYRNYQGTIQEELSDEDTEADAIERAVGGDDWVAALTCVGSPAFITERGAEDFGFSFRQVQVQVTWEAVVSETYEITVRFYRRALGESGAWTFYAIEQRLVVADQVNEETDWIDVPNESGWETRAQQCLIELQPS